MQKKNIHGCSSSSSSSRTYESKTNRKPLREINHVASSSELNQKSSVHKKDKKNLNNQSQNENQAQQQLDDGESIDRLLLIHSDISSLLHQIDDLVGKALRLKVTSENDRKVIELFSNVLSDMQRSLKPWVPKFQQSISSSSLESNNHLEESVLNKTVDLDVNDDKKEVVGSPYQSNWDLLVSPSPLVSWRASCANEAGRQLFLLTPVPKDSKHWGLSKPPIENSRISGTVKVGQPPPPSHFAISEQFKNELVGGVVAKSIPCKVSDSNSTSTETPLKCKIKSPDKCPKIDHCTVALYPCREVSPPKSCNLLEPVSQYTHKKVHSVRASTPFPTGVHKFSEYDDSDSSSVEASEHVISKYPELVGIKLAHEFRNGRRLIEASPVWCMSPPKTCIVMEPPEEELLHTTTRLQLPPACAPCGNPKNVSINQGLGDCLTVIERTPVWKEPESTIRTGKRPGENTLKKELWTKFEAATTHELRFREPVCQDAANRGFLDLLEEVSMDEETDLAAELHS